MTKGWKSRRKRKRRFLVPNCCLFLDMMRCLFSCFFTLMPLPLSINILVFSFLLLFFRS